jgi:hypothetical protein
MELPHIHTNALQEFLVDGEATENLTCLPVSNQTRWLPKNFNAESNLNQAGRAAMPHVIIKATAVPT